MAISAYPVAWMRHELSKDLSVLLILLLGLESMGWEDGQIISCGCAPTHPTDRAHFQIDKSMWANVTCGKCVLK